MTNIELNSFQEIDINKDKQLSFDEIKAISSDIWKKDIFKQILEWDIKNKELNEAYNSIWKDFKEFLIKDWKIDKNDIWKIYIIQIIAKIEWFYDNDLISKWNNDIDWVISKIFNYEELKSLWIGNNINEKILSNNYLADIAYIDFDEKDKEWKDKEYFGDEIEEYFNNPEINKIFKENNKKNDISWNIEIKKLKLKFFEEEIKEENLKPKILSDNNKLNYLDWSEYNLPKWSYAKSRREELRKEVETFYSIEENNRTKIWEHKIIESINEDNWLSAIFLEKDWKTTLDIRGTDWFKDIDDILDIWISETDVINIIYSIENWILLEKILLETLWRIWKLFTLLRDKRTQIEILFEKFINKSKNTNIKIDIVWHSLWWALAQLLAISFPKNIWNVFTYNSPWMNNYIKIKENLEKNDAYIEKHWWDIKNTLLEICNNDKYRQKNKAFQSIETKNNHQNKYDISTDCITESTNNVYNVVWDRLSSKLMTNHIWNRIDSRVLSENNDEKIETTKKYIKIFKNKLNNLNEINKKENYYNAYIKEIESHIKILEERLKKLDNWTYSSKEELNKHWILANRLDIIILNNVMFEKEQIEETEESINKTNSDFTKE